MASSVKNKESTSKRKSQNNVRSGKTTAVIALSVIIVFAIAGMLLYGISTASGNPGANYNNFNVFKSNFDSAQRVAMFVNDRNGSVFQSTEGCATYIIMQLQSSQYRRNASTIDFFVVNSTTCTYPQGGLSGKITNTTVSNCLSLVKNEPTIFINYSVSNSTTITPTRLNITGDTAFLSRCGVAPELVSG